MTDREAIELVHQRAWVGQKPGLERTRRLLGRLGNPQEKLRSEERRVGKECRL